MRTRILLTAIVIAVFFVALVFARHRLATVIMPYDDEGYMLLSFDHYFGGGHLYTEVFSQYGPFNFFAERALFQFLRLPVNHDAGRLVTLICWLLSAVLAGCFMHKLIKNTILASAVGLATIALGRMLAYEPGHPHQLILPLFMLACCASISSARPSALLLGVIGAALFFTKINVGVFYFIAILQTLLCGFPVGRIRTIGVGLVFVLVAGGPLILMRQDLLRWAGGYCLLAIVSGVSVLVMGLLTTPPSQTPVRSVLYVTAGALSAAALIVAETMREGMSYSMLAKGVLWDPLRHPGVFEIPLLLSTRLVLFAVLISVSIVGLYWFRDRWLIHSEWVDALRCLIGLGAIAQVTSAPSHPLFVAFLPLGLIPTKGRVWQQSESFPRLFVTSLAATQFLQAYPVAGSQLGVAAAPLLLWAFLCVHDGTAALFSLVQRATLSVVDNPQWQESILAGLLVLAFAFVMVRSSARGYNTPPSSLRGAASLHLRKDLEDRYESLAGNIKTNCSMLFTMPGMGSLNFWSGVAPPNGDNHNGWMRSFSLLQQEQILHILWANPRSCAVYNEDLAHFWGSTNQDLDKLPLARYIIYDMRKVYEKDGYEIRVHPQRNSPWVDVTGRKSP